MLSRTRNLGILAHVDAGKTTITERFLFVTGATYKQGEVHNGTTVTDYDPLERGRGITIFSAAVSCDWADHRLNLIGTPGHVDFTDEVERTLRVLDGAVVVLDGQAGVEPQTESVWRQADRYGVPRIAFVNKLDLAGADLDRAVDSIRERLRANPLVVQHPVGREAGFVGVVDLVRQRCLMWTDEGLLDTAIPVELRDAARARRRALEEAVASAHPAALEEFCATSALSEGTLVAALRDLTRTGAGLVVLCGSAYRNRGIEPLLDAVVAYLPSPLDVPAVRGTWADAEQVRAPDPAAPLCGLVFKLQSTQAGRLAYVRLYSGTVEKGASVVDTATGRVERVGRVLRIQADRHTDVDRATAGDIVAMVGLKASRSGSTLCSAAAPLVLEPAALTEPLVSVAVEARTGADTGRLAVALERLVDEDPSLAVRTDADTGQVLLSGLGELHLEVAVERLRRAHGVDLSIGRPQVAYRETVVRGVHGLHYRHVKQSGGPGQFAHVTLDVDPLAGTDFEFSSTVVGGRVPAEYVRAVEAGCRDALADGPIGGHPVVGLRVTLTDGLTHPRDSSEQAFRAAGRLGLREALRASVLAMLEPVVELTVVVPVECVGPVLGDLAARRGRVGASTTRAGAMVVTATVPLAELFGYATQLRSRTSGRGTFSTRPAGYALA
jgi:elongation factor G